MIRNQQPSRPLAAWVLVVLVASFLLPLRGEWDAGRLAPWNAPVSAVGILDPVEPALPGVVKVSRGWSGSGEVRWGKDLLDLSAGLLGVPALFWRTEWNTFTPTHPPEALVALGFQAPTLRPRPPPVLSAVL